MMNANKGRVRIGRAACAAGLLVIGLLLSRPDVAVAQVTGTGTTGKVTKWTGATAVGDSVITESATGNVGVGASSPGFKLEVAGHVAGKGSQPAFWLYDTIGTQDSRQFYFWNSSGVTLGRWVNDANSAVVAESIALRNNGFVGFGTINPAYKVDLYGGAASQFHITHNATDGGLYLLTAGSDNAYLTGGAAFNGGAWIAKSTNAELLSQSNGSFVFYGNTGLTAGNSFTPTERMRIDSSGNVGIGVATPWVKLNVYGGRALVHSADEPFALGVSRTGGAGAFWLGTSTGASPDLIVSNNGGTERMRVTDAGNVGIGTPSPTAKLHVAGAASISGTLSSGSINVTGDVTATGNIAAKYQDVAEWVPARMSMTAGTVVVLDPEQSNHVMPSSHSYDTRVAGVVSQRPGLILGERGEGKVMVATTGRVRLKVDATSAPIRVGDLLVTSNLEGIAMRSQPLDLAGTPIHRPGTLIGKALEPLEKGVGEILVLLSLQ